MTETTPRPAVEAEVEAATTPTDTRLLAGVIAFGVLIVAFVWFTMFPRFEIHVINNGQSILIHDRWGNRIQRADYNDQGEPTLKRILTPF